MKLIHKSMWVRPDQKDTVKELARQAGVTQAELYREALDLLIEKYQNEVRDG